MTFPWAVPIAAVLLTAGFLLVVDYADDSEGEIEGFTPNRVGDDVTVTGHGTLEWDDSWNGLKNLTIVPTDGEVEIGDDAFFGKDSLLSVTVQGSVGSIGESAFHDCDALATFTVQGSVGSIGESAFFRCNSLSTFTIPSSVDSIGDHAFEDCNALQTVTVQGSVGSIGESAFHGCDALATVTITGPITSIEDYAFAVCPNLKTVNVACNYALDLEKGSTDYGGIAFFATTLNHVHRYSATYEWADDGSACTVHISCENESVLIHDAHPEVAHTVKIPPTATTMGTTEYSVSDTYDGFAYSDTKDVQDIPSTGGSDSGNDVDALVYIAAAGAIGAVILIGAAFMITKTRRER